MASCKIALFLAFVAIAVASVSCTLCYTCNPENGDKDCDKPQTHESVSFNCSTVMADSACVKIVYAHHGSRLQTARACTEKIATCHFMRKSLYTFKHVRMSRCEICNDDLCNGN